MSNEAKKLKTLTAQRLTEILKLDRLKLSADKALADKSEQNMFFCRYKDIDNIKESFDKTQAGIINIISVQDPTDLDPHHKIMVEFEDNFYYCNAVYKQIFGNAQHSNDSLNDSQSPQLTNIKLPRIELIVFDGNPKTWQTFIDMFNSMIHSNESISNIDKFNYLVSSLRGPPLSLVRSKPLTSQNYIIAYNSLVKRYENKRAIAVAHWRSIQESKKVPQNNFHALRELLDCFDENLSILENFGLPINQWNFILFNMLFERLDASTATAFQVTCGSSLDLQDDAYGKLFDFLVARCNAMDTVHNADLLSDHTKKSESVRNKFSAQSKPKPTHAFLVNSQLTCPLCKGNHFIYSCPNFLQKCPNDRLLCAKSNKWCTNCLGTRHSTNNCSSSSRCRKCGKSHHTLLHFSKDSSTTITLNSDKTSCPSDSPVAGEVAQGSSSSPLSLSMVSHSPASVLLSTAVVEVLDSCGRYHQVRAILDCCSQSNFITSECSERLALPRSSINLEIRGVGMKNTQVHDQALCSIRPRGCTQPIISADFIILPQICSNMPPADLSSDNFCNLSSLNLADSKFNISGPIDMLLGADIFSKILKGNVKPLTSNDSPIAIETIFGWVIMGNVEPVCSSQASSDLMVSTGDASIDDIVRRFWDLEQIPNAPTLSPDDKLAELLYSSTTTRTESGRYIVELPFRSSFPTFGGSRDIALKSFLSLERRLSKDPALYAQYREFMQDYLDSGHMEITYDTLPDPSHYFIPHHCISKIDNSGPKIRVVFNASMKATNGTSLNDSLLVGPKLQQDISSIILRFRLHPVGFCCDIRQMFRQILISPSHWKYQKILWRFSTHDHIQEYFLKTVTYGVNCSPFLANRTLVQLASDYGSQHPLASAALKEDCYVDDIVTGAQSLEEALKLQSDLIELLRLGGFELRKWVSNAPGLVSHLPDSHVQTGGLSLDMDTESSIKILGLKWNPLSDSFSFTVNPLNKLCTKRTLLSEMSRIFDPLGFLVPISLVLKVLVQQLWTLGCDWDEQVPPSIHDSWNKFKAELPLLCSLGIPRVIVRGSCSTVEIHGFCDASEKAYACVVYFRIIDDCNISTFFICSKSRVSPLKRISIPRLELCSALLLAHLVEFVQNTFPLSFSRVVAWSDSTISLAWIKSSPHRWSTFVANRVTQIQDKLPPSCWRHINSEMNPADPASRGLFPSELISNELWWNGPQFLRLSEEFWPNSASSDQVLDTSEELKKFVNVTYSDVNPFISLIENHSSLGKILRITSYILRFSHISRAQNNKRLGNVTLSELDLSLSYLIRLVQEQTFSQEMNLLKSRKPLPKVFRKLNPFIDDKNILRVGGRLTHSSLPYTQKFPILLPGNHRLTFLLIEFYHKSYLHAGPQTLQYLLAQKYWILSYRRTIRKVLSKCINCFRTNPKISQPVMGNLPKARISPIKPFSEVGVDFGGPFVITQGRSRGAKTYKCYLCLFVCMATKALHLEIASDLSSDTFLAALRRFIARRGRCSHIYSDRGTNFVGAAKQISLMQDAAETELIEWHFNPPNAPNFGGLWEAGIKSVKTHLLRVVGEQILSFEEFYTVLVQIESLLNSRPLCPLNDDPSDCLSILSPGMFLNLEPLSSLPDPDLGHIKLNRLSRWQLVQRLQQDFWRRWRNEYLHTLMQRGKWTTSGVPIKIGTMVLLKDDQLSPLKWPLGRVSEVFPGTDGIVRVVSIKTARGDFKRPVNKVCPLPVEE